MNETKNYKLNQWQLTDLIRMDDFNADNAKLDAALAALSGRVDAACDNSALASKLGRTEILWDKEGSSASDWMTVGTKISSWNDWDMYGVLFMPDLSQCGGGDSVYFEIMGPSGARLRTDLPLGPFLAFFLPWHDEGRLVQGVIVGAGTAVLKADFSFKNISKFGFGLESSQGHMFAGEQTTVFGLR